MRLLKKRLRHQATSPLFDRRNHHREYEHVLHAIALIRFQDDQKRRYHHYVFDEEDQDRVVRQLDVFRRGKFRESGFFTNGDLGGGKSPGKIIKLTLTVKEIEGDSFQMAMRTKAASGRANLPDWTIRGEDGGCIRH